jgi:hypothetical protein
VVMLGALDAGTPSLFNILDNAISCCLLEWECVLMPGRRDRSLKRCVILTKDDMLASFEFSASNPVLEGDLLKRMNYRSKTGCLELGNRKQYLGQQRFWWKSHRD